MFNFYNSNYVICKKLVDISVIGNIQLGIKIS